MCMYVLVEDFVSNSSSFADVSLSPLSHCKTLSFSLSIFLGANTVVILPMAIDLLNEL